MKTIIRQVEYLSESKMFRFESNVVADISYLDYYL